MGSLIKTGEVVKVDPRDIIYLYYFIREYITWNLDDYNNFLDKIGKRDSNYYPAPLVLNSLLIPKFRYSHVHDSLIRYVEIEKVDKIKYKNFSYFDVYKFDPNSNGEISEIKLISGIRRATKREVAGIWELAFVILESGSHPPNGGAGSNVKSVGYTHSTASIGESEYNIEDIQGYLKTLRWTQGKSYSKLSERSIPNWRGSTRKIRSLEEKFFLFVNFLYILYTGSFEKDGPAYVLFEPFTEILKTYGNTFEEILPIIKEVVKLVW